MRYSSIKPQYKYGQGFTLVELVIVIVLLGILSVGASGFIRLGSEMFVDTKNRSDMVATGRFITERLNRELRTALPNSIRVQNSGTVMQCLTYMPIITTANYLNIPTASENETATNTFSVVAFDDSNIDVGGATEYRAAVYPASTAGIYNAINNQIIQPLGTVNTVVTPAAVDQNNRRDITVSENILFATGSPTSRFYFIGANNVSYCVLGRELKRFEGNNPIDDGGLVTFFNNNGVLMANNLLNNHFPFSLNESTQFRNATVLIQLVLQEGIDVNEQVTFNNEVHIPNAA